jgi:hypothetical protein
VGLLALRQRASLVKVRETARIQEARQSL